MKASLALILVLMTAAPASAAQFMVRTAGAATAIAIDVDSVRKTGRVRTGWTYELYREHNPLRGVRTQITGVLLVVDCKTVFARRLRVVHYRATGEVISRIGPEKVWTESLRGSNTDLMLAAMCTAPDEIWARRRAKNVFELYREVWR